MFQHISISPTERGYTVDLEPFMNTAPYSVYEVRGCWEPFKNTSPYSVHEVRGSFEPFMNTSPYSVHEVRGS